MKASDLPHGKPATNRRTGERHYRLGGVVYLWNGRVLGMVANVRDDYSISPQTA